MQSNLFLIRKTCSMALGDYGISPLEHAGGIGLTVSARQEPDTQRLHLEVKDQHIDPDLVGIFVEARVWEVDSAEPGAPNGGAKPS